MQTKLIEKKINSIQAALIPKNRVLVSFSGGVDSSVVAAIAHEALGKNAIACTAKSETLPESELLDSISIAEEIGIQHEIVNFSELDNPDFVANDTFRCYHCQHMRFEKMYEFARKMNITTVCDGTNASDLNATHRPGLRAIKELQVFSPLLEFNVTKEGVRDIARFYNLSVAEKPAMACLSSRIPTGISVTSERLARIEQAESIISTLGFSQVRVRDHDGIARIEVGQHELDRLQDPILTKKAEESLLTIGFNQVIIDPSGYRTGGANLLSTKK